MRWEGWAENFIKDSYEAMFRTLEVGGLGRTLSKIAMRQFY